MTERELKDVREIGAALKRVEWVDGRCPWCSRRREYGLHVCSCPRRLALRACDRLLGTSDGAPDAAVAALIAELRKAGQIERGEWGLDDGANSPGSLLVEQAADVLESWNVSGAETKV